METVLLIGNCVTDILRDSLIFKELIRNNNFIVLSKDYFKPTTVEKADEDFWKKIMSRNNILLPDYNFFNEEAIRDIPMYEIKRMCLDNLPQIIADEYSYGKNSDCIEVFKPYHLFDYIHDDFKYIMLFKYWISLIKNYVSILPSDTKLSLFSVI